MKTSSLLGHVVEVLDIVLPGRRPADTVIREFFRARHYLGSSDRRFIAERTFDVLRNHRLLTVRSRVALGTSGGREENHGLASVILVAAHEATCAAREGKDLETDIAALWKASVCDADCGGFIDAVIRAELPEDIRRDGTRMMAVSRSIPEFVAAEWIARFGPVEAEALCAASNGSAPVALRANTLKGGVEECRAALAREGIAAVPGTLSPVGLVLPKRINAHGLHAFRQGLFEMQDEGSQLVSMLLEVRPGMTVLDACAGAGGKTLHLAAMMQNRGKIVACDVDPKKLENLVVRARRAGVTIAEPALVGREGGGPAPEGADAVLVDAPCTGVGTFRRNPGAKLQCTEEDSRTLAAHQRELLERYAHSVRSGGRLVYSTCTLLQRENQDVVGEFLSAHPEFSLTPAGAILGWQHVAYPAAETYMELFPHRTGTDGFFAAVLARS